VDAETILIHQVHPLKLAADISASVVSNMLLWQHRLGPAVLARYVPPIVGSALVIRFGDLDALRQTSRAKYVLAHMPPASTAIRLAGDVVMAVGSWRRRPAWIAAGALIVAAGWSHGLIRARRGQDVTY
jgi:hypothetical protein